MQTYKLGGETVDSIELKCLVVSQGLKVSKAAYKAFSDEYRLNVNPLTCNSFLLPDKTVVQLTDTGFHLQYLGGMLSWSNLKLLRYASEMGTDFLIDEVDGKPALLYKKELVTYVTLPEKTDFYKQKTSKGTPFIGNAVLQGVDWVAFQCLWPCEYAAAGKPCQYCFSGADDEERARKGKPMLAPLPASDVAEIIAYGVDHVGANSVQITGGSTFSGKNEAQWIREYLDAVNESGVRDRMNGEMLLYITPPEDHALIDEYFQKRATRIACSLEVWDEKLAAEITPGKIAFTTRKRHLEALEYIAEKYGPNKAFSNFIIGLEPLESLKEGAKYLAERGIIPTASIWMPMGRPVRGSMKAPGLDYYRSVKEYFAELYDKYHLEPTECCGLNVCMERDIWRYATGNELV